jgi:hypothetical protein
MDKIYGVPAIDLMILPEKMVVDAAMVLGDDPNNNFNTVLNSAKEFRDVGLRPVFLCDQSMKRILVTTREALDRKLH